MVSGMATSELFIENTRIHAGIIISEIIKQIQVEK
ncbi:MAG: hypothetical protein ACI8VT_003604 [Saprospiraceae bacterium]